MTSRARPRWWPHISLLVADSLLALGLGLLAVYEFADPADDGHQAGPLWLNAPLSVLLLAPLAVRRRARYAYSIGTIETISGATSAKIIIRIITLQRPQRTPAGLTQRRPG